MKKKFLTLLLALLFILPCAFGFTACTKEDNGHKLIKIQGLEIIVKDNEDVPNFFSCTLDTINGNKEAFTSGDLKVYYTYSNGSRRLLEEDQYTYKPYKLDEKSGKYTEVSELFQFLKDGETTNTPAGSYKLVFTSSSGKYTQDLIIEIKKKEREAVEILLNQYTNADKTESKVVTLESGKEYYEISYAASIFEDNQYFFSVKNQIATQNSFFFTVVRDNGGYEAAIDKTAYINSNKAGSFENGEFKTTNGNYLAPGEYLVFAKLEETDLYAYGFSTPIKVRINPVNLQFNPNISATFDYNKLFTENATGPIAGYELLGIQYKDIITTNSAGEEISLIDAIKVPTINNTNNSNYAFLKYFSEGEWKLISLKSIQDFFVQVHAYKSNDKYYLADYNDDKWYVPGTMTEIEPENIEFIDYTSVEEFKNSASIKVPVILTINDKVLDKTEKENLKGYNNVGEDFKFEMTLNKYTISYNANEEIFSNLSYNIETNPNGLSVEKQNNLATSILNNLGDCDSRLYTIDFTGIKDLTLPITNGEYELNISLLNNHNLCFVRNNLYFGESYSYTYDVYAEVPAPQFTTENSTIEIEYIQYSASDKYLLSTYVNNLNLNYTTLYIYEIAAGETIDPNSIDETMIAKIKNNGIKYTSSPEEIRLINRYVNPEDAEEQILGKQFIVYIETNDHVNFNDSETSTIYKIIEIKKHPKIDINVLNTFEFDAEIEQIEIDLSQFIIADLNNSQPLNSLSYEVLEYVNILQGSLQIHVTTTNPNNIVSIKNNILTYYQPADGETICLEITVPANNFYFEFTTSFVISLSER